MCTSHNEYMSILKVSLVHSWLVRYSVVQYLVDINIGPKRVFFVTSCLTCLAAQVRVGRVRKMPGDTSSFGLTFWLIYLINLHVKTSVSFVLIMQALGTRSGLVHVNIHVLPEILPATKLVCLCRKRKIPQDVLMLDQGDVEWRRGKYPFSGATNYYIERKNTKDSPLFVFSQRP